LQKLAEICIRRPVFAAMLILALVVVGGTSYLRLGVDRFPSVDLPTVSDPHPAPRRSAEEVETGSPSGSRRWSTPSRGSTSCGRSRAPAPPSLIVTFNLNRDIDTAAQDVRDRVATILRELPDDATPPLVSKFDNDSSRS